MGGLDVADVRGSVVVGGAEGAANLESGLAEQDVVMIEACVYDLPERNRPFNERTNLVLEIPSGPGMSQSSGKDAAM